MTWNYRLLAFEDGEDIFFDMYAIYYDKNRNPISYSENPQSICGNTKKEMKFTLKKMKNALKETIYWGGDRFPEIYEEDKYKF